jgi:hypothetical protein
MTSCAGPQAPAGIGGQVLRAQLDSIPEIQKARDYPGRLGHHSANDPTNEARALILLENKGLIKLNPKAGLKATIRTSWRTTSA